MEEKDKLRHRGLDTHGSGETKSHTQQRPRGEGQESAEGTSAGKPPPEDPIPLQGPALLRSAKFCSQPAVLFAPAQIF